MNVASRNDDISRAGVARRKPEDEGASRIKNMILFRNKNAHNGVREIALL